MILPAHNLLGAEQFSPLLIRWYERHKRDLPWRHTQDPYLIWLSEVILQQTRVKQGLPYYLAFADRFPTVFDLAAAEEQEVLRLWQGLGYYSRARNLQATARLVAHEYQGKFPATYAQLIQLRGIGPYTAAAIASFAFNEAVAVVDGNVYRVLARLYGIADDITSPAGKRIFAQLANQLIPNDRPALHNQAIMEFGALQCTPVAPDCLFCPFNSTCVAALTGQQQRLPVKAKKSAVRTRYFNYVIFHTGDLIGMKRRESKDIWQGLYDFPLVEHDALLTREELVHLPQLIHWQSRLILEKESKTYTHVLTHQRVEAKFWHVRLENDVETADVASAFGIRFVNITQADAFPKPILIEKYLKEHIFSLPL